MVGVTGFEPATSRPPAVRATNCATPRYEFKVIPEAPPHQCEISPRVIARWVSAVYFHRNIRIGLPNHMTIQENHMHLAKVLGILLLYHSYAKDSTK